MQNIQSTKNLRDNAEQLFTSPHSTSCISSPIFPFRSQFLISVYVTEWLAIWTQDQKVLVQNQPQPFFIDVEVAQYRHCGASKIKCKR